MSINDLLRIILFGTIFGIISDVIGDVILHGYHYQNLLLNFVFWFLFWAMMAYFLPSESVWKPLRYMWVGWYAFLFEAISVSTGFLRYNMPVNYKWTVSFFADPSSYIPVCAMMWVIYTGIQIAIAVDLFKWIQGKKGNVVAYTSCIALSVILALILTYIYVVVGPIIF